MKKQFYYPQDLKTKPKLWLWSIRDLILIVLAAIPSAVAAVKLGFYVPTVLTALFAFLSIRLDDQSVMDYLRRAVRFFISTQQCYWWRDSE